MTLLRVIANGVRSLLGRQREERELEEELYGFLEMATEEKLKGGMSREEAARAVRLERGSFDVTKETVRSAGWESVLQACYQDLRFGLRTLHKFPGFPLPIETQGSDAR